MHKRPWHSHAQVSNIWPILNITQSAQCVFVEQMIFWEPGFIAQLKGCLTGVRYTVITLYINHFSRLCFINFQKTQTSAETLESKNDFEAFWRQHSHEVHHYHCDICS